MVGLYIRSMLALGADRLILTNASGGLNPQFNTGDVVVVTEHINLMWDNPLTGLDGAELAERLPAMFAPYDPALVEKALSVARREGFAASPGVYVAMNGPSYKTRAEYRMLRRLGGEVVSMPTVPEVIVAAHCGNRVLALPVVTNVAHPDVPDRVSAQQVLSDASRAAPAT